MISAAANPVPQASCAIGDQVFYGSKSLLVCWNSADHSLKIVGELDSEVRALCATSEGQVLAGTESGSIYKCFDNSVSLVHKVDKSVTCIGSDPASSTWVVGSMDGKLHVFTNSASGTPETVVSTKGYALCVAVIGPLVISGGTANQIAVHHLKSGAVIYMTGHESWVRSLSIRQLSDREFVVASASQERYIRLWRFNLEDAKPEEVFSTSQRIGEWSAVFEALLMGHDDWVVSVQWDPYGSGKLLSASADSSLIVWEAESPSDLWTPAQRLGDLSTWGGSTATGTSGGFWIGLWLRKSVATVTRTGSLRVWLRDEWSPVPAPTGHFKEVTDVAWFHNRYILTTSLDQTTRLWFAEGESDVSPLREIGRPQIHGYDMIAIAPVNNQMFVSAGDEKVMRVFELPQQVATQMAELTPDETIVESGSDLPPVAGVPALGLSNKTESDEVEDLPPIPREDHLQRLSLWPEIEKLYGHGFEISALAVSPQLHKVVSCCRANSEKHAVLRFYSTETWHEVASPVGGHSLTVTNLKVSPDGTRVLSVSRDRKYMIVDIAEQKVVLDMPKAHSRIIWDGCWLNNSEFCTASRDKTIKKWDTQGNSTASQKFEHPLTAIDSQNNIVVAGDETGTLFFMDSSLSIKATVPLYGRINRVSLNLPLIAVASDLIVSVIRIPPEVL